MMMLVIEVVITATVRLVVMMVLGWSRQFYYQGGLCT